MPLHLCNFYSLVNEFEDQLEEVAEAAFDRKLETVVRIHFQRQEFDLLRQTAKTPEHTWSTLEVLFRRCISHLQPQPLIKA